MTFEGDVRLRVAKDREEQRRRRVIRSLLALIAMTVGVCAVVVWQRNSVRLAAAAGHFEGHLHGLLETYDATGTLPRSYPPRQPDSPAIAPNEFTYIDGDMVHYLRGSGEPLIVAYTSPIRQVLRPDVRVVAVLEEGRIGVDRLPAARFDTLFAAQEAKTRAAVLDARGAEGQGP